MTQYMLVVINCINVFWKNTIGQLYAMIALHMYSLVLVVNYSRLGLGHCRILKQLSLECALDKFIASTLSRILLLKALKEIIKLQSLWIILVALLHWEPYQIERHLLWPIGSIAMSIVYMGSRKSLSWIEVVNFKEPLMRCVKSLRCVTIPHYLIIQDQMEWPNVLSVLPNHTF